MSLKINKDVTIQALEAENSRLEEQITSCTNQALAMSNVSCSDLGLKGKSYEAISNRINTRPLIIQTHSLAYEAIKAANITNAALLEALPDSPGTPGVLDTDECDREIENLRTDRANLESIRDELVEEARAAFPKDSLELPVTRLESHSIIQTIRNEYAGLIEVKEEWIAYWESVIEQAYQYKSASSTVYANAKEFVTAALNDSTANVRSCMETGAYSAEYQKLALERQEFLSNVMEQYGFDIETALILWDVWVSIGINNPDAEQKELDWMFTRAISQLSYNLGDILDEQWRAGAGFVYGYSEDEEREYFLGLGLSEEQYKRLRYKVRVQNQIVGNPSSFHPDDVSKWKGSDEKLPDGSTRSDLYYTYKSNMERGLGRKLTDAEFDKLWSEQYNSFCTKQPDGTYAGKTDLAHMMYTIAAGCVAEDAKGVEGNYPPFPYSVPLWGGKTLWTNHDERRDCTGWLGDATHVDDETNRTSLGPDDYTADLDADNIRRRMQDQNLSFMQASAEYYSELDDNPKLRTQEFKESHSYDSVQKVILLAAGVQSPDELIDEKHADTWIDSYNFLKSLQNDNSTMWLYHQNP